MSARAGVLGLGLIGSVWARHLDRDGLLAASWNRTPKPDALKAVDRPRDVAEKADVLIIVVADPPAVQAVLDDLLPACKERHLVVQSSTVGPRDSLTFQKQVEARGARYLEAPFTGSKPAAEARKTVFYQGGTRDVVQEAEPILKNISISRFHVGTNTQACSLKLAMNLQIATVSEALCEALAVTRGAGIDDDTFFACMRDNVVWSPLAELKEPKLRAADYGPQFSVKHLLKDLRLLTREVDGLPALDMTIARLRQAAEHNHGDRDFSVMYELIEAGIKRAAES